MISEYDLNLLKEIACIVYFDLPILKEMSVVQAIHESGYNRVSGASDLALKHNNLFGIKAKPWQKKVPVTTWEEINGRSTITVKADFIKFDSAFECFTYHRVKMESARYKPVLEAKTVVDAFIQLYKCGWATDSAYPDKLTNIYHKLKAQGRL